MTREYFTKKTGSDNNPGTAEQPFLTVQRLVRALRAGDLGWIGPGDYNEVVVMSQHSGTRENPIMLSGIPGEEKPRINGMAAPTGNSNAGLPTGTIGLTVPDKQNYSNTPNGDLRGRYHVWEGLFDFTGVEHIILRDVQVVNSMGRGIRIFGDSKHIQLLNVDVHYARSNPVLMQDCSYVTINGGEWMKGGNYFPASRPTSDGNWSGTTMKNAHHVHVEGVTIHHNWCEPFIQHNYHPHHQHNYHPHHQHNNHPPHQHNNHPNKKQKNQTPPQNNTPN